MTVVRADSREYSPTLPKQTSEDSVEESPERIQSLSLAFGTPRVRKAWEISYLVVVSQV